MVRGEREGGIRGDVDRSGEFRATWSGYLHGENLRLVRGNNVNSTKELELMEGDNADVTKNHFFSYAMFCKKIFVCIIIIGINIWSTQNAK